MADSASLNRHDQCPRNLPTNKSIAEQDLVLIIAKDMVNIGIPQHYTVSPSSFSHTPSLKINHEAALDLDSSNAFEGPEKLLEVWFSPSPEEIGRAHV